ncbi:hypothetical protein FRB90_006817 [Tulasnella sp. 427]|nr:hypothetical protein FRB90_006817 [Tulasnella sp. 427]
MTLVDCGCVEHPYPYCCAHEFHENPLYRNSRMIVPAGLKTRFNILKFNCFSKLSFDMMQNPLVARYVAALVARPLLTKCYTSGVLGFFQEILANHIAGVKFKCSKDAALSARIMAACKMDGRAVKMALYGFFVSAPMNHYMNLWMQKWFAGRTSIKSKIGHLCAQMFLVAPIQTLVFLVSMAYIGGARGSKEILGRVRMAYVKMLTLTWLIQPTTSFVATRFVPAPDLFLCAPPYTAITAIPVYSAFILGRYAAPPRLTRSSNTARTFHIHLPRCEEERGPYLAVSSEHLGILNQPAHRGTWVPCILPCTMLQGMAIA